MFGRADVKVRPVRLGYLVDPNNPEQVREAFRLSSTLWGGAYFPIVTLHKRTPATWRRGPLKPPPAKEGILGYIEAFDPDILVQLSKDVPQFVVDTGIRIISPEEIWGGLDDGARTSPQFGIGIFELLNDIFDEHFKYKLRYPLRVVLPEIPERFSLFWTSWLGEIPPNILSLMEEHYFEPLQIQSVACDAEKINEIFAGNYLFPRRITQVKLSHGVHSRHQRGGYVYFLDATKVEDLVDFWNLRALGREVLPVPKQLRGDPHLREMAEKFIKRHRRPWKHNPAVCDYISIIKARNCTLDEVRGYAQTLKLEREVGDPSDDPFFSIQEWYPRIWDGWARDKDEVVPNDVYGVEESSIELAEPKLRFRTLLPKFAHKHGFSGEPRCANEVSFRFYGSEEYLAEVFPKSSGPNFSHAISGLGSLRREWRVGRNGLVRLVKFGFAESRELPRAENIFFAWLADLGWSPELSAPGVLAKQIFKKLGGNLNVLRNEKLLKLLEHMNGGRVKQDGGVAEEARLDLERDLPVSRVKKELEDSSEQENLHDYLASKGIFRLGLRIKCPHCLRHSWFSLDDVRDTLACPKCLNAFPAIGNIDNANWHYKTAGPFSVWSFAEGAYAVLLTSEFFAEDRMPSIRTSPVLSFTAQDSNKKRIEADFATFWQDDIFGEKNEGLLFGECKTYGEFKKKDFDRMLFLAKTFPGAVLVFSTLRKTLTAQEIAGITRVAKVGRKYWKQDKPINPVLILTGTELLGWSGPPSCWEESNQKKLDRARGLLGVCDATQQIYLGLPSWQNEWAEKWEKRNTSPCPVWATAIGCAKGRLSCAGR